MIKRLLLLTLFTFHASSHCDFQKLINAAKPLQKEIGCAIAAGGIILTAGGYYWGSTKSAAALARDQYNTEQARIKKEANDRLEKTRQEEKERKEREEAIKAVALRKSQAEAFAAYVIKEYADEIELQNGEKFNEHFFRVIISKSNQKPFNTYNQSLETTINKLAQFEGVLDTQKFEQLESQLKNIRRTYNFLFSNNLHEETLNAQKEKNAAEIKRIEIEHAQLQNQKLRAEEEAQIETKKALKIFNENNQRIIGAFNEMHSTNKKLVSTLNSYHTAVIDNTRNHEANHQNMALQLRNRETVLDRKFEAQAAEVRKVNEQMAEVANTLKQVAKVATELAKAQNHPSAPQNIPTTGNPQPTTTVTYNNASLPVTATTEQAPPPTYVGDSLSSQGVQAIPVPRS